MVSDSAQPHWDGVYSHNSEAERSWSEPVPMASLELIAAAGIQPSDAVVDVGGGASRLVDALLKQKFTDLTVLDVSSPALEQAMARLAAHAAGVHWIAADIRQWRPERSYRLWHDRALFHFLTGEQDRRAYLETLRQAVGSGGCAILATFAEDGPERCSGLPVRRYTGDALAEAVGSVFSLVEARQVEHHTPWGSVQPFLYALFRRL
jgi:cyclopropane fatty-acyl-phospholipid synthase-like methyltransferase